MKCKFCKCTDQEACFEGCSWAVVAGNTNHPVELNVCTNCIPEAVVVSLFKMTRARLCDSLKANACHRGAVARSLERIGPAWYLIRKCSEHGDMRDRVYLYERPKAK